MTRPRLAWFSPMPPVRSGVAACSAELVPALRAFFDIDVFVDLSATPTQASALARTYSAHDFVWRQRQAAYDLTVFQLGNSSTHDFIWPYLLRYPGLAVLHDAHLHHARAATLLRAGRAADYRAEFHWNHPAASVDLAELAVAGFDNHLYYHWPMTRLAMAASRVVGVHATSLARELTAEASGTPVEPIRLGHGVPVSDTGRADARARARARLRIADDLTMIGCFGSLSPDKRVPQILDAFADTRRHVSNIHLLLAGAPPAHYDPQPAIERLGIRHTVTRTGYLDRDEDLTAHIAACDLALTLRWPTAREISGPWLRCLAAGTPTVIVHLAHMVDVPSLDPRTWHAHSGTKAEDTEPVCVAIDILDEDHSLRLAMRRLARDPELRQRLSRAGQRYWNETHSLPAMVEDYRRVIPLAMSRPAPDVSLPEHARTNSDSTLLNLLGSFGLPSPLR